jgi:very-short-patch-repair endonuclease
MNAVDRLHFQMMAMKWKFVRELRFHPTRLWRFDFAFPDMKIAVEVHGGIHKAGRHTRGTGFRQDREKMNSAQLLGWIVLEVTPEHIKSGQAIQWIELAINIAADLCDLSKK